MVYLNLFHSKQWLLYRTLNIEHIKEFRIPNKTDPLMKIKAFIGNILYPFRITFTKRFTLSTLHKSTKTFLLIWLKSKVTHTKTRGKSLLITS